MTSGTNQTVIRIDLNTVITLIGIAAILMAGYFIIKQIPAVPGDLNKKLRGLFGKRSALESLQKQVLQLQEENDRLTLARMQAEQQLDKLLRYRQEKDDELLNAKAELEEVKQHLAELKTEHARLLEYCKDLRRRIAIGSRQARRESLSAAAGLVKLGVDKSISAVADGVTEGLGMLQNGVVKVNAKLAETVRTLPHPYEDDLPEDVLWEEYSETAVFREIDPQAEPSGPICDSYDTLLEITDEDLRGLL